MCMRVIPDLFILMGLSVISGQPLAESCNLIVIGNSRQPKTSNKAN